MCHCSSDVPATVRCSHSATRRPDLKPAISEAPRRSMRASYLLFVTSAAIILSIGKVVALVTSAEQSEVSTVTSLDQVHLVDAVQNSGDTKRFLRIHKPNKATDEERGFNAKKFDRMMNDQTYRNRRFDNWIAKKYTDSAIYDKLLVRSNPLYSRIFNAYQSYIKQFAKNLVSK
ncbi:uncharacterized protein KRP23_4486 [Phytophthora ramorum]|uniref:uncharacterized protein n=1 Tax=Phytophthora ramorum TaxID=164328 RepID=UPI0030968ABA|nr:hypothetical protein KRP23_4486 [Phytophthora ramorum]KAH7507182.1 hypothetical protein KRP22_2286 [Phytophthora ramorum]